MTAETGFVPKYQKIINELHAMLRQGVLKPGDKLPSREELVERYGVTRATVNRAVGELLREGLLKAAQRGGTFVSDAPEIEEKAAFIVHIELLMAHLAEWNSALNFYSMFGRLFQLVPEEKRQILNVTDVRAFAWKSSGATGGFSGTTSRAKTSNGRFRSSATEAGFCF